jgi:hypothetical protein
MLRLDRLNDSDRLDRAVCQAIDFIEFRRMLAPAITQGHDDRLQAQS